MPIKYVGRTTDFKGKTLWEIVGNLKNFGVGRVVVRSIFERYPEPSYLKICKVEALANEVCFIFYSIFSQDSEMLSYCTLFKHM